MQEPIYIIEDAADVVSRNISEDLRNKLTYNDLLEILEAEFEFLELCNIASSPSSIVHINIEVPAKLDEEAMEFFIISRCAKKNIYLSSADVKEILDAEMIYLSMLGLIDE